VRADQTNLTVILAVAVSVGGLIVIAIIVAVVVLICIFCRKRRRYA